MKRMQIKFLVMVMICAPCLQKTGTGAEQKWTVNDIIDLAQAHSSQIKDIQYTYKMQVIPVADPNYIANYEVTVMWLPEKDWEKRTTEKTLSTSPDEIYQKVHAWNGEYDKYNIALVRTQRRSSRKEGIISSKKGTFSLLEPLDLLDIKGGSYRNLSLLLSGKDVLVEGLESINGHEAVVVSVNRISNLPRKDSLVMKYWLDMKCGALPRHTELYHQAELRRVISDMTISEIKPGLFFPTGCKVRTFGGKSEGRWSQGETTCIQIDVNSVNVNQGLQKKDFNVEFEYAQPVWNEDIGTEYYEGLDTGSSLEKLLDMLDQLVDQTFAASASVDSNNLKTQNP